MGNNSSLSLFVLSLLAVSPTKEIKIVSAVRRSSMSSCGSSGYFSSSPTLSSSPPVLCNPKSGEHQHGLPCTAARVRTSLWGGGNVKNAYHHA